jgi:hypothetical protein
MADLTGGCVFAVTVVDANEFNEGWLAYVLGVALDETRSEAYQAGFKMAEDTPGLAVAREVFERQAGLAQPQYVVSAALLVAKA